MSDSRVIDLAATWERVKDQPTDWYDRRGLEIRDGVVHEVRQSAAEMGRPPGNVYTVPVKPEDVVYARPRQSAPTDRTKLKPGCFYWAKAAFDPDATPWDDDKNEAVDHWSNQRQPARFDGWDAVGEERWHWLNSEAEDWPAIWVGHEIVPAPQEPAL